MELRDKVFTEKYRPVKWEYFISPEKEKLKKMLENPFSMQHLLLVSSTPGTGKTSLAKLIFNLLQPEYLIINSSNDRKIEVIRDKIVAFASTKSTNSSVPKFVLLDELDGTTKLVQEALRNVMETYANNCKFIITANNINKIHEAIVSRCISINFTQPDKNSIKGLLIHICNEESLKYDAAGIDKLVDIHYPSIRNMINYLQDLKIGSKDVRIENIKLISDVFDTLWNQIKQAEFGTIKEYIIANNVDVRQLNKHIWTRLLDEQLTSKTANLILQLAENEYRFAVGSDQQVVFISGLIKIITILKKE